MPLNLRDIEKQLRDRLKELEPLLKEADQLGEVLAGFERARSVGGTSRIARTTSRQPSTRRRGRPRGSTTGGRSAIALRLVSERPGITVGQLADEMSIGTTYLYRVMPALEREGKVRKVGTGYEPTTPS